MAKNLTDLTERTATANTDLMHINSGGTDYKETKLNFLKGEFNYAFTADTLLTTQVDALPAGTYFGSIASVGHQTETGVPINAAFFVEAHVYSSTYKDVILISMGNSSRRYILSKGSNGWGSSWKEIPGMSTPSVSMGTINASESLTITASYAIVFLFLNSAQTAILGCRSGAIAVFEEGSSISVYASWSVNSSTYTINNLTNNSGLRYCVIQL